MEYDTEEFYNYTAAVKACEKLDSELWEVTGGKEEWEAVSKFMNEGRWRQYEYWLSAEVIENCPAGAAATCDADKAE